MVFQFFGWFFRTFTPYLLGVCIGVGFFFLLVKFVSGPQGLMWETSLLSQSESVTAAEHISEPVEEGEALSTSPAAATSLLSQPVEPPTPPPETGKSSVMVSSFVNTHEEKTKQEPVAPLSSKQEASPLHIPRETLTEPPKKEQRPKAVVPSASSQPKAAPASPSTTEYVNCGYPPRFSGPEMDRFLACQQRNACLSVQTRGKLMLEQQRNNCVMSGQDPVVCRDYYAANSPYYSLESCNRPQAGYPSRRW
ncbi:MAG: hypothetical protein HQL72_10455 [Magnetococcales bacterium]|nr:hypothetical protein [Magnetococcales bacterium]